MSGALEKIKVLEFAAWVAGPGAGAILGDWGAEIIKIEDPITGDAVRSWRSIRGIQITDVHFWFEVYNRNKKSVGLDLRSELGREIFYKLVKKADVFLSNFQYPVLEKLKVDYKTLSSLNPMLIYAVVNGYGKRGRDSEKPGYDLTTFWARSGILNKMIPSGADPVLPPHAMGDTTVGMFLAGAISAALFDRQRTGLGQELDLSLFHAAAWVAAMDVQTVLHEGKPIPQIERTKLSTPLENMYKTKDGKWLLIVMIQSDRFWPSFCKALKIEHLEKDAKFKDAVSRERHCSELISMLDGIFITKTCLEWEKVFEENGLICGPIQSFDDIVNDPQALENGLFSELKHHATGKKIRLVSTPINFDRTPASVRTSAPELGQHTEEILLELGYCREDIASFRDKRVIK